NDKGILPDRMIATLAADGVILPAYPLAPDQIQPASLDLRLADVAFRVRASFLPGRHAMVAERIDDLKLHEIDLGDGAVLETGCVYIVPLIESLALPPGLAAAASPDADVGAATAVSGDLSGERGLVGYRAKRHTGLIDIERRAGYEVGEFWEAIAPRKDRNLILDPNEFYILASKEAVQVPPDYAAEMVPFDPLVGEFRVHYAGFFDPGFGYSGAGGRGSRAVLEVRSREVPFILEHGQTVGRLVYEKMLARPGKLYGEGIGSNYQAQGLKLSKHFR